MSETIDNVSERLNQLELAVVKGFDECRARDVALAGDIDVNSGRLTAFEVAVAQGFHESAARDAALNRKIDSTGESLNRKIDANTDAVREDIRALREEMQRTNDSIRQLLVDHSRRLDDLEDS
jgi:hypothetical protein